MLDRNRALATLLLAVAVAWHILAVTAPPKILGPVKDTTGRDFASYHYAVQAAVQGENPYDTKVLKRLARQDGTRNSVHPFFYPPPYVLVMTAALPFDLETGYLLWYWLNELCLLACALVLMRWWRGLDPRLPVALTACIALMSAVAYSLQMGQVNFVVMLMVILGLWADDRDRPITGGALVGLACMLKMSSAVFVAWWLLRGRWIAVASAIGCAIGTSMLALPLVDGATQWQFYTDILPKFGSGDYNGLVIKIAMFGNHSVPNVIDQILPGHANQLSAAGQALSGAATLTLVTVLGLRFRHEPRDIWSLAGQIAAVSCAALLIPVYTYEHHLVWALPAMALAALGVWTGRLGPRWAIPVGLALAALCYPLPQLKQLATQVLDGWPIAAWLIQELKFAGLLTVFAAAARLGGR